MVLDLWYVFADDASDPALLDEYRRWLPEDERAEEQRFRFEAGRRQTLISRVLVRLALSARAGIDPSAWTFVRNRYGKPAIATPARTGIEFNLSHTHGLIVCAVGEGTAVGIDVEDRSRGNSGMDIARRFFAPAEVTALEALPEAERQQAFFAYWTLKEAFIKGRGLGMSLPLEQFAFRLCDTEPPRIEFATTSDERPDNWQFARLQLTDRYPVALAVRLPESTPVEIRLRPCIPLRLMLEPTMIQPLPNGKSLVDKVGL